MPVHQVLFVGDRLFGLFDEARRHNYNTGLLGLPQSPSRGGSEMSAHNRNTHRALSTGDLAHLLVAAVAQLWDVADNFEFMSCASSALVEHRGARSTTPTAAVATVERGDILCAAVTCGYGWTCHDSTLNTGQGRSRVQRMSPSYTTREGCEFAGRMQGSYAAEL